MHKSLSVCFLEGWRWGEQCMHENWHFTPILHFFFGMKFPIAHTQKVLQKKRIHLLVHSVNVPVWVWGLTQHFYAYTWKILTLRWERVTGDYSIVVWPRPSEGLYRPNLLSLPLGSCVSNTSNKYRTENSGSLQVSRGSVWAKVTLLRSFCKETIQKPGLVPYLTVGQCQRQSGLIEFWCINLKDKSILPT